MRVVLPLDPENRATCSTCHESHRDTQRRAGGARLRVSNLRRELCLACHRDGDEAAPRIDIVAPLAGAIVREERVAFIGRAANLPGEELTVRLNGVVFHLHVKGSEFSTWLTLREGVNAVEILQDELQLWRGEIFQSPGTAAGYERTSSGHRTGNRAQCRECHERGGRELARPERAARTLCFGCHDRNDEKRFVHGPLAVGDCLACHDPHGGFGSAHLRQEQAQLCRTCHAPRVEVGRAACDSPGKPCIDCHDPHQSDTRYLLKGRQYTMRDMTAAGR